MKILFSIMCLFVSLYASAQVRTGGGPDIDKEFRPYRDEDLEKQVDALTENLKRRDLICRGKSSVVKHKENFQKVSLWISMYKTILVASNRCEEADKFMKCLYDSKTEDSVKSLLMHKTSLNPLFRTIYSISERDADVLVSFLEVINNSSCNALQRNSCGM